MNFANANSLWASVLAETLVRLGVQGAVICPGSRSAPVAIALASHPSLRALPVLDERSAAFFALGWARQAQRPVVLVCTSGTAGANFFPAIIEARESQVPLVVLTADRPAELRDCASGQTIDQVHLFGRYPVAYAEVGLPEPRGDRLAYLRQTIAHAVGAARHWAGPVHLNVPFRDPLPPIPDPESAAALAALRDRWQPERFFAHLSPPGEPGAIDPAVPSALSSAWAAEIPSTMPSTIPATPAHLWQDWQREPRGIIVAGPAAPADAEVYCRQVGELSRRLGWPVLAEGLSPLRNFASLNPFLIASYDLIVRHAHWRDRLAPRHVLRLGPLPTAKELRAWLADLDPLQWLLAADAGLAHQYRNLDPLHGRLVALPGSLAAWLAAALPAPLPPASDYLADWQRAEAQTQAAIAQTLAAAPFPRESKVAWLLGQVLPPGTPLWIGNSMPVRDVEWFWPPSDRQIQPVFNRGANGIDGGLSSALGLAFAAAEAGRSCVMLTGDLALLHDTNGFLLYRGAGDRWQGSLTVVLINNEGGGIFEMLPIAQFDPPFEDFFATPQRVEWASLCAAYGVTYRVLGSWQELTDKLSALPSTGLHVLALECDRKADAAWRRQALAQLGA